MMRTALGMCRLQIFGILSENSSLILWLAPVIKAVFIVVPNFCFRYRALIDPSRLDEAQCEFACRDFHIEENPAAGVSSLLKFTSIFRGGSETR